MLIAIFFQEYVKNAYWPKLMNTLVPDLTNALLEEWSNIPIDALLNLKPYGQPSLKS